MRLFSPEVAHWRWELLLAVLPLSLHTFIHPLCFPWLVQKGGGCAIRALLCGCTAQLGALSCSEVLEGGGPFQPNHPIVL